MTVDLKKLAEQFDGYLKASISAILGSSVKFVEETAVDKQLEFSEQDPAGVIGVYCENFRGTLVLAMTFEFARVSSPMGLLESDKQELIEDWVGEATNLIAGQLRKSLESFKTRMSPPTVEKNPLGIFSRYEDAPYRCRYWFTIGNQWASCQWTWQ